MLPSKAVLPEGIERRTARTSVLNSWKEIAGYLKCGVRTAQRWERDLLLPVYRPRPGKRGPVCAFPSEIQTWLRRNKINGDVMSLTLPARPGSAFKQAAQLTHHSAELLKLMAANTRLQQEYATRLLKTIEDLKVRVRRTSRVARVS